MLSGRLPYGKGFATARDARSLTYNSLRTQRDDVPAWIDAALQHAVRKAPSQRTEALSELIENLRHPNPAFVDQRPRPIIERNPVGFWRAIALAMLLINVVLLFLLAH